MAAQFYADVLYTRQHSFESLRLVPRLEILKDNDPIRIFFKHCLELLLIFS